MKKIIKNKKFIFSIIVLATLFIFSNVFAWELEVSWPRSPGNTKLTPKSTIAELVQYLYEWGIALGGLAAFISLVVAGFQYLTSTGDPAKMQDARDRIYWALGGLILLLASWLILNTINPELTTLKEPSFDYKRLNELMACDTDDECRYVRDPKDPKNKIVQIIGENCQCYGDPKKGDGKKQGVCFCGQEQQEDCDFVIVYAQSNFRGDCVIINGTGNPLADASNLPKCGEQKQGGCGRFGQWGLGAFLHGLEAGSSQGMMIDGRKDTKCYLYYVESGKRVKEEEVTGTEPKIETEKDNCFYSEEEVNGKKVTCKCFRCLGFLQFFSDYNCQTMMAQILPTNRMISYEDNIHSVKFVTEPKGEVPAEPPIYPTDMWFRIWFIYDPSAEGKKGSHLGEGPHETNLNFDNNADKGVVAYGKSDNIMFISSRTIEIPADGNYTIEVGSDDGVRLWIDEELKLDKWSPRSYAVDTINVNLTAGEHNFRLDYFEAGGSARISFNINIP